MRTTVTLEDDVVAIIERERQRTGATFKESINALVRRGGRHRDRRPRPPLPVLDAGSPTVDLTDVSEVLARLDEEDGRWNSSTRTS